MAHRSRHGAAPTLALALTHSDWLTRLAETLVRDAAVARDLSAEALERLGPREDVRDERAFLSRVVERLAVRHQRGEARRRRREHVAARARAGASPAAAEVAADLEVQRLLLDAVSALREPAREVLVLRFYHGLSAAEIARSRDISPEAARKRLQRAVEELRQHLDRTHPSRDAWLGALAPLTGLTVPAKAPATAVLAMVGGPVKLTCAVALVAAVAAAAFLFGGGGGSAPPPVATRIEDETARDDGERSPGTEQLARAGAPGGARIDAAGESATAGDAAHGETVVTLLDAAGAVLANTDVLSFDGDAGYVALRTDTVGRLGFAAAEGSRAVAVPRASGLPHVLDVDLAEGDQRITVPRGAVIAGAATVDGAAPGEELELRVVSDRPTPEDPRIREALAEEFGPFDVLRVAADGAFRFEGLADDWHGSLKLPRGLRRRGTQYRMFEHDHVPVEGPSEGMRLDLVSDVIVTARIVEADGETPVPRAFGFVGLAFEEAAVSGGYSWRADDEGRVRFALHDTRPTRFNLRFTRADGTAPTEFEVTAADLETSLDLGDLPLVAERALRFRAVDAAGSPIAAAVAYLGDGAVISEASGPDGLGTLRGLPVIASTIEVVAPGYAPSEVTVPGDDGAVVEAVLASTSVLEIVVLGPDGEPEPRASVRVDVPRTPEAQAWSKDIRMLGDALPGRMLYSTGGGGDGMAYGLVTDERARLTLQRLPPSVPILVAALDGSSALLRSVEVLPLAPDERRVLELRLDVRLRDVTGVVVDAGGRPIAGAKVGSSRDLDALLGVTAHAAGMVSWSKKVDDEGRFEIRGTSAAQFALTASAPGFAARTILVGEDDREVRIALEPGGDLVVRIVDESGTPVANVAEVVAADANGGGFWVGEDRGDGTWQLAGVPLRPLRLEVEAGGATLGGTLRPGRGDQDVVVR